MFRCIPARSSRVLIVEDHAMFAHGLAVLLEKQSDLTVAGIAETATWAIELAATSRPDLALLDYHLPDLDGPEVARAIRRAQPDTPILFLSRDETEKAQLAAVEAGATGYLHKSICAAELMGAMRRVLQGETLISARAISELLARRAEAETISTRLTVREREVLHLLAEGLNSRSIADRLRIRYGTVRSHVRNLTGKLCVHSKLEAIARSRQLGLLGIDSEHSRRVAVSRQDTSTMRSCPAESSTEG